MDISALIIYVMAAFMLWAAFDKAILNNRFGYGAQFDEGMAAIGPMATAMVGFMCLAPVMGKVLTPIVAPVFQLIGADSSMLAGSLLALDMGGYALAKEMTTDAQMAVFSGGLYASMMGVTLTFTVPVALGILKKEDQAYLAKGVMSAIIVIPVAGFAGGLIMGLQPLVILCNLIPAMILSALLAIGLVRIPDALMKGFMVFSRLITVIMYASLAAAILEQLTGIVLIPGMAPIGPQLETVGIIGITLAGAYPFVHFVINTFQKPLRRAGSKLGVNEMTVGGMVAALANTLPTMGMVKDMNPRGKTLAIAFMVPAGFALGDHLAYASANMSEYIVPMVATKLIGGALAVCIAFVLTEEKAPKKEKVGAAKAPEVTEMAGVVEAAEAKVLCETK